MIQVTGSLTILNAHEDAPSVFWNGVKVEGITGISVSNGAGTKRVILTLPEDPVFAEMQAAGIVIKRSTV